MIRVRDLLGRPYSRDGLGPDGPLSCTGATLAVLERGGILRPAGVVSAPPGMRQDRTEPEEAPDVGPAGARGEHATEGSRATHDAEAILASWAGADGSPWTALDPYVWIQAPRDFDVLLLERDGDPAGLAVVVDAARRKILTSVPQRGVVVLPLSSVGKILRVYRWPR